jgi:hypothetical protein
LDVAGVGVDCRQLAGDRLDHVGVGVSDARNVVVGVEVVVAVPVDQVGSMTGDEFDRLPVHQHVAGAEDIVPPTDGLLEVLGKGAQHTGVEPVGEAGDRSA